MKKAKSKKYSNKKTEKNVLEDYPPPLEFCEVCFIALGSQEQRVFKDSKVAHIECAKKIPSNWM